MAVSTRYALLCGAIFLALLALGVHKPGLPTTLKADEPAYFLMALSLALDGDLECEAHDYQRLAERFPYLPTENLILMSDDGGRTVLFGKPYLYSLVTAPFARVFGANGMVAVNALMFILMIAFGVLYLRRFNSEGSSTLFATAFFLLSPAFPYVFWLQPEIFNMAAAAGCLFFAFHRFSPEAPSGRVGRLWALAVNDRTAPVWSAGLLALGTYNKPVLALVGVPALIAFFRRRGSKAAKVWLITAALTMGVVVGGSVLLTGHATPYLGAVRTGVKVDDPQQMEPVVRQALELTDRLSTTGNTWSWMFRLPSPAPGELRENLRYFLVGRHVGLFPYFPVAAVCFILFLLHGRRSPERWASVAVMAATALFFILTIPLNWHGGGGFIGNRYFAMVYPAFLFLVTALRPLWLMLPAVAAGGLFLGPLLLTPLGAPVLKPTIQAHVRGPLYRVLPFELSLRSTIPGYATIGFPKATFIGRKDVFRPHGPDDQLMWIHGANRADILLLTDKAIEGVFFRVTSSAPDNRVRLTLAGDAKELLYVDARNKRKRSRVVELRPQRIDRHHVDHLSRRRYLVYDLSVTTTTGRRIDRPENPSNVFYLGAELAFLGRRDQVGRPEHYRIHWLEAEVPESIAGGSSFRVPLRLRNAGASPLSSDAELPVLLSYHWLGENGQTLVFDGRRSRLPRILAKGEEAEVLLPVDAPLDEGRYRLVLDAVRDPVAWFSERGGDTSEHEIDVIGAAPEVTPGSPVP